LRLSGLVKERVTITIRAEHDDKIRILQSKLIASTQRNWSYSKVIELIIDQGLKSFSVEKAKKSL
jgi:hypothetical protein